MRPQAARAARRPDWGLWIVGIVWLLQLPSALIHAAAQTQAPATYQLEAIAPITSGSDGGGAVVRAVATTDEGATFVVGDFRTATVRFGHVTLTNSKAPNSDLFVARVKPDGSVAWAFSWGGNNDDFARGVAWAPLQGKVYVLGDFRSAALSVADARGKRPGLTKGLKGDLDVLVARLDGATGSVEWVTRIGDDGGEDVGIALVVEEVKNRPVLHVAGWYDIVQPHNNKTQRDTFVSVVDSLSGEELVDRGQFWTADGDEVLTAAALSPLEGMLYVVGISDSDELILDIAGGILPLAPPRSETAPAPRAFLVALDTRRSEVAWSLSLEEVAPTAASKEPDTLQASLPLAAVTGVAVNPTDPGFIYVTGAFTAPAVLRLVRSAAPVQQAALLAINVGQRGIVWAGLPAAVTPGVGALAMDVYGYLYAANAKEVVKLDHIADGPAVVLARQVLSRCGAGPTDVAVDLRGSAYVACIGGSVGRTLVQPSYTLRPTPPPSTAPTAKPSATLPPTITTTKPPPVTPLFADDTSKEAAATATAPTDGAAAKTAVIAPPAESTPMQPLDGILEGTVKRKGPNMVGIAAGVVMAVLGAMAAAFFVVRSRRARAGEEAATRKSRRHHRPRRVSAKSESEGEEEEESDMEAGRANVRSPERKPKEYKAVAASPTKSSAKKKKKKKKKRHSSSEEEESSSSISSSSEEEDTRRRKSGKGKRKKKKKQQKQRHESSSESEASEEEEEAASEPADKEAPATSSPGGEKRTVGTKLFG